MCARDFEAICVDSHLTKYQSFHIFVVVEEHILAPTIMVFFTVNCLITVVKNTSLLIWLLNIVK
ncbi:MAG: hypothetical protein HN867_04685 [Deltaproteobacteria bacterium]|nr:hypothetical protein [Deltaproteobacteria bacterium]